MTIDTILQTDWFLSVFVLCSAASSILSIRAILFLQRDLKRAYKDLERKNNEIEFAENKLLMAEDMICPFYEVLDESGKEEIDRIINVLATPYVDAQEVLSKSVTKQKVK